MKPQIKPIKAWAVVAKVRGIVGFELYDVFGTKEEAEFYKRDGYLPEHEAKVIPVLITPIKK